MLEDNSALKNKKVVQLAKGLLGFKLNEKNIRVILKFSRMAGSHLSETPWGFQEISIKFGAKSINSGVSIKLI